MNIYKVEAEFKGMLFTAVVVCDTIQDAAHIAGFDGEAYTEQEAVRLKSYFYEEPTIICREILPQSSGEEKRR